MGVDRIGPGAGGVDGERAVGRRHGARSQEAATIVDVGCRQRRRRRRFWTAFVSVHGRCRRNDRRIVGPGHRHRHHLRVVPSAVATVTLSVSVSASDALRADRRCRSCKSRRLGVRSLNVPFCRATALCAINVDGLSTSLLVSVPPVVRAASVSFRLTVADDRTAASLVPRMFTVTEVSVPSVADTEKVSVSVVPTLISLKAEFAV